MQQLVDVIAAKNVTAKAELDRIQSIRISQIQLRDLQPRRYFDPEALEKLTESIREHGMLQPLIVRPVLGVSVRYELVVGERRFRAAQAAGLDTVIVVVRQLSDIEAATLTLVENLQRQDLNAIEQTEAILALLALNLHLTTEQTTSMLIRMAKEVKGQTAKNLLGQAEIETVISVFDSLGLISWKSFVTSRLPLLSLPQDLQQALQTQVLDYTKAITLSRFKDDKQRSILLKQVLEQNWSVRQIQAQLKLLRHSEPPNKPILELVTASSDTKTVFEDNDSDSSEQAEAAGRPLLYAVTLDATNCAEFESTPSQLAQQELQTLPAHEPLHRQLNLFNFHDIFDKAKRKITSFYVK